MDNQQDRLESDLREPYQQWQQAQGAEANARMLEALDPTIRRSIRTHVGQEDPLTRSRARRMALQAVRRYDPARSGLKTHVQNELQGLKRYKTRRSQPIRVPERVMLDKSRVDRAGQELESEYGRPPNDDELAQNTGLSHARIRYVRRYSPALSQGYMRDVGEQGEAGSFVPGVQREESNAWTQLVYDDLSPEDRKIMEWSLGLNNQPRLATTDIARRMKRSPGAVSQRRNMIQQKLNEQPELSPF